MVHKDSKVEQWNRSPKNASTYCYLIVADALRYVQPVSPLNIEELIFSAAQNAAGRWFLTGLFKVTPTSELLCIQHRDIETQAPQQLRTTLTGSRPLLGIHRSFYEDSISAQFLSLPNPASFPSLLLASSSSSQSLLHRKAKSQQLVPGVCKKQMLVGDSRARSSVPWLEEGSRVLRSQPSNSPSCSCWASLTGVKPQVHGMWPLTD